MEKQNDPDITDITEEIICRVGEDHSSRRLFINELQNLDEKIAKIAAKRLGISEEELHSLTAVLIDLRKKSKYGGGSHRLTKKLLKLKFNIKIEECELVDDVEKTD